MPYKDKAMQRKAQLRFRRNRIVAIEEYKMDKGCCVCGYRDHPRALQFHHREPEDKVIEISTMLKHNRSVKAILEEATKCDVICANCHLILHAGPQIDAPLVVR